MVSCSLFLHVRGNLVTKFAQNDIFKCLKSFYSTNCLETDDIPTPFFKKMYRCSILPIKEHL